MTPKKRDWRPGFIAALRNSANVRAAARAAGVSRQTAYRQRSRAAAFREQWDEALDEACDLLEAEARVRATQGVVRKKFGPGGQPILDPETQRQYVEREYSDVLLIFLLKAHRPEKYREHRPQDDDALSGLARMLRTGITRLAQEDGDAEATR